MLALRIRRYEQRNIDGERLAREAGTSETAFAHQQGARLCKTELAPVRNKRAATVGQTLAEVW
jgi:hypothetical protein